MKRLIFSLTLLGTSPALANDDTTCRSYGAQPGTDAYVNCRVALKSQRERAAPTFRFGDPIGDQIIRDQLRRPLNCTHSFNTTTCY